LREEEISISESESTSIRDISKLPTEETLSVGEGGRRLSEIESFSRGGGLRGGGLLETPEGGELLETVEGGGLLEIAEGLRGGEIESSHRSVLTKSSSFIRFQLFQYNLFFCFCFSFFSLSFKSGFFHLSFNYLYIHIIHTIVRKNWRKYVYKD
jgi:hypothetical protein